MAPVKITQPEEEIPTEIIAQSIKDISDGMEKIRTGRLNDKAIVLLLHHASGVSQTDVRKVLIAMNCLADLYLNEKKKK